MKKDSGCKECIRNVRVLSWSTAFYSCLQVVITLMYDFNDFGEPDGSSGMTSQTSMQQPWTLSLTSHGECPRCSAAAIFADYLQKFSPLSSLYFVTCLDPRLFYFSCTGNSSRSDAVYLKPILFLDRNILFVVGDWSISLLQVTQINVIGFKKKNLLLLLRRLSQERKL